MDNKVWILGGGTSRKKFGATGSSTISEYDVDEDSWKTLELKLPYPLVHHFAAIGPFM